MFSVPPQSFASWPSPVARRHSSHKWGGAPRPRRRRRFSGDGSPSLPRCTRHGLGGGRSACRVSAPVMSTMLTAPSTAMEAKGQHPSGASEALLRAVLSIPHRSPLRAASSLPESLRALASPLMPLNPPAKRNPTDRQCPALASSLPFIGRELPSLPIIPGGCGCKSPDPSPSSLPERRNWRWGNSGGAPACGLGGCGLEAARKQHGPPLVPNFRAVRDEPDLNNIVINSMPGTSSVRAV